MPTKRSRMMRSASTGDVNPPPPPRPPTAAQDGCCRHRRSPTITPPLEAADQPTRPPIFRIPSPVYDHPSAAGDSSRGINIAFDKCYHCSKSIPQDGDVFMYSLRAYCSVECRERHICIDEASTKMAESSKKANDVSGPRPKKPYAN